VSYPSYPLPAVESLYPIWWGTATTIKLFTTTAGSAVFDVGDVQLLSYGVAFPANEAAEWDAGIVPWSAVQSVSMNS
jgi:hypothetical protein